MLTKNINVQKSTSMYDRLFISQKTKTKHIREMQCLSYLKIYLYYNNRNMITLTNVIIFRILYIPYVI